MNRFKNIISKSPIPIIPKAVTTPVLKAQDNVTEAKHPKKYQRYSKEGPQILMTRILMVNGPLQNKEIWRVYQRMLKDNSKKQNTEKLDFFKSLTHMKTVIKFMKIKEKVKSAGFDRKARQHKGWQIQTVNALKFVHPEAIQTIQKAIGLKDII